jgi:hypothetical protein
MLQDNTSESKRAISQTYPHLKEACKQQKSAMQIIQYNTGEQQCEKTKLGRKK